jgi:hypothetical protein
MNLRLVREPSREGATLGALYVDGVWHCWVLEDEIRERPGVEVAVWKVPTRTAIPAGRYRVVVSRSNRFSRAASQAAGRPVDVYTPELLEVPGFEGIRIHPGNTAADTDGCLITGRVRDDAKVLSSAVAYQALLALLRAATAPIWIDIENPPAFSPSPAAVTRA